MNGKGHPGFALEAGGISTNSWSHGLNSLTGLRKGLVDDFLFVKLLGGLTGRFHAKLMQST
jgi:hypothetical protein